MYAYASSQKSKLSGENLSVIERKMEELERENFDLKMRLHYTNDKLNSTFHEEDDAEKIIDILRDRDSSVEQLRLANDEAHTKIVSLSTELALVKSKQSSSTISPEDHHVNNARFRAMQLEENMKREREAAHAIALHDELRIKQIEKELQEARSAHEADALLVADCGERVAELMQIIKEKNRLLEKQTSSQQSTKKQLEALQAEISKKDIQLIQNNSLNEWRDALLPPSQPSPSLPSYSPFPFTSSGTTPALPLPSHSSTQAPDSYSTNMNREGNRLGAVSPVNNVQTNFMSHDSWYNNHSRSSSIPNNNIIVNNSSHNVNVDSQWHGPRPAPKLGAPAMASIPGRSNQLQGHPQVLSSHANSTSTIPTSSSVRNLDHATARSSTSPTKPISISIPTHPAPTRGIHSQDTNTAVRNVHFHPNAARDTNSNSIEAGKDRYASYSPSNSNSNDSASVHIRESRSDSPDRFLERLNGRVSKYSNKPIAILVKELEAADELMQTMTEQNTMYKEQLEVERLARKSIEKTLEKVRMSAEEITLLEAEEIARLENDLEKMTEEKSKYFNLYKQTELKSEQYRIDLIRVYRDMEHMNAGNRLGKHYSSIIESLVCFSSASPSNVQSANIENSSKFTSDNDHTSPPAVPPPANHTDRTVQTGISTITAGKGSASSDLTSAGTPQYTDTFTESHGGMHESVGKHVDMNSGIDMGDSTVIEMYRRREIELLQALEGVVNRCRQLEVRLDMVSHTPSEMHNSIPAANGGVNTKIKSKSKDR